MTKKFGNLLIVISLIGLSYTVYPIIKSELEYRFGQSRSLPRDSSFAISLPTINAAAPIIANVDPTTKANYQAALKQGIAHAAGTATPDQPGTVYLFAHSSAAPWELIHTNPAFFRLNRLQLGDPLIVAYKGEEHHYQITDLKVVWPSDTQYLTDSATDQLILQTCTPIGTDFKRLLVFAARSR